MKKLILIMFLPLILMAQNTDKQSVVRSGQEALIDGFEATLEAFRVKHIDANGVTVTPVYSRYSTVDSLTSAADTLTTSWVDLGAEVDMRGYTILNIFVTLDIDSSNNPRIRALGLEESGGSNEYNFMIETVSSSDVKIDAEYVEFNSDSDQKAILRVETLGVPFIQLQGQVGTKGTHGAQYDRVYINKLWR